MQGIDGLIIIDNVAIKQYICLALLTSYCAHDTIMEMHSRDITLLIVLL